MKRGDRMHWDNGRATKESFLGYYILYSIILLLVSMHTPYAYIPQGLWTAKGFFR